MAAPGAFMDRSTRDALLDAARVELRGLEHAEDVEDRAHRARLEVLVEHLRDHIPSPLVLEAVTSLVRRRR